MKTFIVTISREITEEADLEIQAESEEEARAKAATLNMSTLDWQRIDSTAIEIDVWEDEETA